MQILNEHNLSSVILPDRFHHGLRTNSKFNGNWVGTHFDTSEIPYLDEHPWQNQLAHLARGKNRYAACAYANLGDVFAGATTCCHLTKPAAQAAIAAFALECASKKHR